MKKKLSIVIAAIGINVLFCLIYRGNRSFSCSRLSSNDEFSEDEMLSPDFGMWIDTIMYASGHSFGYGGDLTEWGGWYFDTIFVGDDRLLTYDSVGPASLKLGLITRELIVDLGDADAPEKIKRFMAPIAGFKRFVKSYEECIDSIVDEEYGTMKYMGNYTFEIEYSDSCNVNADKINRFVGFLAGVSENDKAKVPALSAFYAGHNPSKYYTAIYTGDIHDITALSDYLAEQTFRNWKSEGEFGVGSNQQVVVIRPQLVHPEFVTFSKYEYDRQGTGHGMYTETFHTLSLTNGNGLKNRDIFKPGSLDNVKLKLFEVIAKDPHYLAWNREVDNPAEIEERIRVWQSPDPIFESSEEEETEEFKFELPEGALTDTGVIFSFQPYEIDCWAAGAYHFIVPYNELMPYLTPRAKTIISTRRSC